MSEILSTTNTNKDPQTTLPLIGEEVVLPTGSIVQTPNPELITELQSIDSRIKYFPTDLELASSQPKGYEYNAGIARVIGGQIQQDFEGETVAVRGTVASLTKNFPMWPSNKGDGLEDMHTVIDILQSGTDTALDETRVGFIDKDGELNSVTKEWLSEHFNSVDMELSFPGTESEREQVFPIVIVYRTSAFENGDFTHGWNNLIGKPSERIAAIYITDKIISK